ncbi:MAG: hypothetical protein JW738_01070, partial [Actinobacteria bacterium]|nr:hypothetical protein [Actinomycetota bacterium]
MFKCSRAKSAKLPLISVLIIAAVLTVLLLQCGLSKQLAASPNTVTTRKCAHGSIGATAPSDTWYLAEGSTQGGFETW